MKIYATLKPAKREPLSFNGGYFISIDLLNKDIKKIFSWFQFDNPDLNSYLESGLTGACCDDFNFYIASQFSIFVIDKKSYDVKKVITDKSMNILHGICIYNNKLYVTSTGNDSIIVYGLKNYKLDNIFYLNNSNFLNRFLNKNKDFRLKHKSSTGMHKYHLNDINVYDNKIYITTKNSPQKNKKGMFAKMDIDFKNFEIISSNLDAPHDGILNKNFFYLTQSESGTIAKIKYNKKESIDIKVNPKDYFIRGFDSYNDYFFIGFSNYRLNLSNSAKIVVYDKNFIKKDEILLNGFFDDKSGCAVHSVFCDE